jgi:hypothetical protein
MIWIFNYKSLLILPCQSSLVSVLVESCFSCTFHFHVVGCMLLTIASLEAYSIMTTSISRLITLRDQHSNAFRHYDDDTKIGRQLASTNDGSISRQSLDQRWNLLSEYTRSDTKVALLDPLSHDQHSKVIIFVGMLTFFALIDP